MSSLNLKDFQIYLKIEELDNVESAVGANEGEALIYRTSTQTWEPSPILALGSGDTIAAKAERTTNVGIVDSTDTVIQFESEVFDYGNVINLGSWNTRLTFPTGGTYNIIGLAKYVAGGGTSLRELNVKHYNSSEVLQDTYQVQESGVVTSDTSALNVVQLIEVNANDYITLTTKQESGGSLDLDSASLSVSIVKGTYFSDISFRVNNIGGSQTVSASVQTLVNWTTVEFDNGNNFDLVNDYYVIPQTGRYVFQARVAIDSLAPATVLYAVLTVNGSTQVARGSEVFNGNNTGVNGSVLGTIQHFNVGDQVALKVYQTDGAAEVITTNSYDTFFTGCLVGGIKGDTGIGIPVGGTIGQVLAKASGNDYDTEWVAAGSGGATVLDDLTDVDTTTVAPVLDNALIYDGSLWVPGTVSTVGSIDDLTDVDTTTAAPSLDDLLSWDGTNWTPTAPSTGTITEISFLSHRNAIDQTLTALGVTALDWTNTDFNNGNDFSTATDKFTAPQNGRYTFLANVTVNSILTDGVTVTTELYKNGSLICEGHRSVVNGANNLHTSILAITLNLVTNDEIDLRIDQNQSDNVTIDGRKQYTFFSGHLIGGVQGIAGPGVAAGGTINQVLAKIDGTDYNTQWVNQTGGASALNDLTDVTITSAATGDVLRYSGAAWVDAILAASDISDFATQVGLDETSHADVIVDGDFTTNGSMERTGAGTYATILNKRDATVAPTATDDTGSGYSVGSRWIDITNDKEYVCLDSTSTSAVWTETTGSGGGSSTWIDLTDTDPTTFTGQSGKVVAVNVGETGLEFIAAGAGDLKADGTVPLTANWDVGSFSITALTYTSDQATGTAPFTVVSTTVVTNLNASLLEGNAAAAFELADATIIKEADVDDTPVDAATTAPISSNWAYDHAASHAPSNADNTAANETSHIDVVVDGDFAANGSMERTGAGAYTTILNKRDATSAPVAGTDDVTLGYSVGSRWIDITNDKEYVCLDNTDGAAVWTETTGSGGGASSLDGLTDVDLTTIAPVIGDHLTYDGTNFIPLAGYRLRKLTATTTDATETELLDGATRISVPSDSTIMFEADIVARRTDIDNDSASYKIKGIIDNNAGTTALVGTIIVEEWAEDNDWTATAVADDTNDAIAIKVTGEAAKTIKWLCVTKVIEVNG